MKLVTLTRAWTVAGMMGLAALVGCGPLGGYVTPDGRRVDEHGNPWQETPGTGMAITSLAYRGAAASALGRWDISTAGKLAGMGIITDEARNLEVAQAAGGNNNNNSGNQQAQQQQVYVPPANSVDRVWVEHGVIENNQVGMRIHLDYTVRNAQNRQYKPIAYFHWANGEKLMDCDGIDRSHDGQVSVAGVVGIAPYPETKFNNDTIFIPVKQLDIRNPGRYNLKFNVGIFDFTSPNCPVIITQSGFTDFIYTIPEPAK